MDLKPDLSRYFETGWNKHDDQNYMGESKSQFSPFEKNHQGFGSVPIQIQNDIILERSKMKPVKTKIEEEFTIENTRIMQKGSDLLLKETTLEKDES